MTTSERERYLKIGVFIVVGLFVLNYFVLDVFTGHWEEQGKRIDTLREQVKRGHALMEREAATRERWAEMQRTDLPPEVSQAENDVFKGVNRWVRDSKIALTSLTPQWRTHDEGYETLECRAVANGDQDSLGRLIYDLETDPLPVRLEECEFSTRDKTGRQLTLNLRFSFVRLAAAATSSSR